MELRLSESKIALAAIALAMLSLSLLFIALNSSQPRQVEVSGIAFMNENALVSFSGNVKSIEVREGTSSMKVCDDDACATVVLQNSKFNPYLFEKGNLVNVTGRVREYKGTKLVNANGISGGFSG